MSLNPTHNSRGGQQFFENQVHRHINQNDTVVPRTTPYTRTVAFNSSVQTTNFSQQDSPTTFEHMNHERISDQEAFFVERPVPLAHAETPESIDTGNCIFSGQINFPRTDK